MTFDDICGKLAKDHGLTPDDVRKLTPYGVRHHFFRPEESGEEEIDMEELWNRSPEKLFREDLSEKGYSQAWAYQAWLEKTKTPPEPDEQLDDEFDEESS